MSDDRGLAPIADLNVRASGGMTPPGRIGWACQTEAEGGHRALRQVGLISGNECLRVFLLQRQSERERRDFVSSKSAILRYRSKRARSWIHPSHATVLCRPTAPTPSASVSQGGLRRGFFRDKHVVPRCAAVHRPR